MAWPTGGRGGGWLSVQHLAGRAETSRIPCSALKARIAAGEVSEVVLAGEVIRATVRDSLQGVAGRPEQWTAVRWPDDEQLMPLLEAEGVAYSATATSVLGQAMGWLLPISILILFRLWMLRRIQPGAQGVMTIGKNRARIMGEDGTDVTFDDVAGADEAKAELVEVVGFLKTPEKFAGLGAKIPKGVLLVGPPGTGKTLLARAVAGEAGVTFFSISGSEFVELFVGVGASRVRDLFEPAKAQAPCIVFIDELDALGKARGGGGPMGGHDEREQTLNQLLVEMDGFDPRRGVIIMGATNRPETLDAALLRSGRFDRQVVVDRPDRHGRAAILEVHAADIALDDDVDMEIVARRTPGFVGADLANLLNEAALLAARSDSDVVTMFDVEAAIDRIIAGLEKRNRLVYAKEREIVAYHEAGHALVAERVGDADPVHKISIVPRGVAALGPIAFQRRQALFLQSAGGDGGAGGDFSEATARLIDSEVHRVVMDGYARGREILVRERHALERVAQRLLEQEVIERDELRLLIGEAPIPPAEADRSIGPDARAGAAAVRGEQRRHG